MARRTATLRRSFGHDRPTAIVVIEEGREPEVVLAGIADGNRSVARLGQYLLDEHPAWHELICNAADTQTARDRSEAVA